MQGLVLVWIFGGILLVLSGLTFAPPLNSYHGVNLAAITLCISAVLTFFMIPQQQV